MPKAMTGPPSRPAAMPVIIRARTLPYRLYRLVSHAEHAEDFMRGRIRLSTLSACRHAAPGPRRDPGEGTAVLARRAAHGERHRGERSDRIDAARWRTPVADVVRTVVDGLILCTTAGRPSSALVAVFGRYCIEILDPRALFMAITRELAKAHDVTHAILSQVHYVGRDFSTGSGQPPHIGLLKPSHGYTGQQEIRMLWTLAHPRPLRPGVVMVSEASRYCALREL